MEYITNLLQPKRTDLMDENTRLVESIDMHMRLVKKYQLEYLQNEQRINEIDELLSKL